MYLYIYIYIYMYVYIYILKRVKEISMTWLPHGLWQILKGYHKEEAASGTRYMSICQNILWQIGGGVTSTCRRVFSVN